MFVQISYFLMKQIIIAYEQLPCMQKWSLSEHFLARCGTVVTVQPKIFQAVYNIYIFYEFFL